MTYSPTALPHSGTSNRPQSGTSKLSAFLQKLNSIEVGGPSRKLSKGCEPTRIGPVPLAQLLRLLLMLLQNGLSLPKALGSLAMDRSNRKYSHVLLKMRGTIVAGGTISDAMARYPRTFSSMQVQQIRLGERSGSLETAMSRVCEQMERKVALRKRIIKKISYPMLITVAGFGLMIFMCLVVVPEFETVYSSSGVDLPPVTQFVTGTSRVLLNWGWIAFPLIAVLGSLWIAGRRRPKIATKMDAVMLKLPIVGPWLRDAAVLQFVEATAAMVQCGYKPVDAIEVSAACVRNRCVRQAINEINQGVRRGEKLSVELGRYEQFFPATLCQLIGVGEQSGEFSRSLEGTCHHLRERLESRIDATVGMLEPILTISLAAMIGGMVLSIYTPMFHMFEVLE
ncbi:type II secretion system F family protein [Rhodopirellula sp. SWK7]|uniref:type II secretion system F family protein n=1 Tax=Rhodopirellula sp. SWK7 TaxID=595460 RepID=UPI0002BE9036|nr:type II secretion system F family protein [Rhodopirellula sp. SWK7]EMI46437.1 general secretion pathway protein F [Rhodopirellula sp. SWK7]